MDDARSDWESGFDAGALEMERALSLAMLEERRDWKAKQRRRNLKRKYRGGSPELHELDLLFWRKMTAVVPTTYGRDCDEGIYSRSQKGAARWYKEHRRQNPLNGPLKPIPDVPTTPVRYVVRVPGARRFLRWRESAETFVGFKDGEGVSEFGEIMLPAGPSLGGRRQVYDTREEAEAVLAKAIAHGFALACECVIEEV